MRVPFPEIPDADLVEMDDFCGTCHETYAEVFANNVHRDQGCEKCHGAATVHLETRGKEPGTILSFKTPDVGTNAGKLISAAERSEICLQCHENHQNGEKVPYLPESMWRTSAHAHNGIACTDCHRAHYLVPLGTPPVQEEETAATYPHRRGRLRRLPPAKETAAAYPDRSGYPMSLVHYQGSFVEESPRGKSNNLGAVSPDVCYRCHSDMRRLEEVVHPHQIGVPLDSACTSCHDPPPRGFPQVVPGHPTEFNCTTCHDPHGNIIPETRKDLCLTCHDGAHMGEWHSSPHDLGGVACTDCHNPHPKTGLPMSVNQPGVCYRCHADMRELQEIAGPHQICGPNGFNCNTCHRPHGKLREASRTDLCLTCHDGAHIGQWHASTHNLEGVGCTDCHNPHPRTNVPRVVNISHTNVRRPARLPMSVDEPEVCYKCHPKMFALSALPSHHPIKEGKMICSDCHDPHRRTIGALKADSVNLICYKCHGEKRGPFVYEHPPVTENCAYCHEPHGTVANNLLRQPTTFLCLRCHSGHRDGDHWAQIDSNPAVRPALYTDCTQCHSDIHGSNLPAATRVGPLLTY